MSSTMAAGPGMGYEEGKHAVGVVMYFQIDEEIERAFVIEGG